MQLEQSIMPVAPRDPASPDAKIFDAIQRHRAAEEIFGVWCIKTDVKIPAPADVEAYHHADKRSNDIRDEILAMVPQTTDGARAIMDHALECDWDGDELQSVVELLRLSPIFGPAGRLIIPF